MTQARKEDPARHPFDPTGYVHVMSRHFFDFDPSYRWAALPLGVTSRTAHVDLTPDEIHVRFGPWRLRTSYDNVVGVEETGGFAWWKTAGPPHLSFSDRGVTFATNGRAAVCLRFGSPVAGIDPTRRILHPGATLTVVEPHRLAAEVRRLAGLPA